MSDTDSELYDPLENVTTGCACGTSCGCVSDTLVPASDHSGDVALYPYRDVGPKVPASGPLWGPAPSAVATVEGGGASPVSKTFLLRGLTGRVRCLCTNPTGAVLCAGGECGSLCFWDFGSPPTGRLGNPTRTLTPFPNRISGFQAVVSVHSASDGSYFVACQDGDSPVVVAANGKQLGYCCMGQRGIVDVIQCSGHRGPVTCSAPSVASRFLTGSQDGTARIWDVASFEQRSVYAVKHGTGQLLDNVVVEAVLPLLSLGGDKACVFATGGEDGLVQLWDSRQRYRPGGAFAVLDMYNGGGFGASVAGVPVCKRAGHDVFRDEKHVGGMTEPDPTCPTLCVRCGSVVRIVDLRQMVKGGEVVDVCAPLTGLPPSTDTGPLVTCTSEPFSKGKPSFFACTNRSGYQHVAGGHVVQFTYMNGNYEPVFAWRPASADVDVVSIAVDVVQCQLFAGTQTGTITAWVKCIGMDIAASGRNVHTWMGMRPATEKDTVGRKRCRAGSSYGGDDELML